MILLGEKEGRDPLFVFLAAAVARIYIFLSFLSLLPWLGPFENVAAFCEKKRRRGCKHFFPSSTEEKEEGGGGNILPPTVLWTRIFPIGPLQFGGGGRKCRMPPRKDGRAKREGPEYLHMSLRRGILSLGGLIFFVWRVGVQSSFFLICSGKEAYLLECLGLNSLGRGGRSQEEFLIKKPKERRHCA